TSIAPVGFRGSRAERPYSTSPTTTTRSTSNPASSSRSNGSPIPAARYTTTAPTSPAPNSGVNTAVSTGARFSTMLFFDSTSHAATIVAATAPDGSTHTSTSGIACGATGESTRIV